MLMFAILVYGKRTRVFVSPVITTTTDFSEIQRSTVKAAYKELYWDHENVFIITV